MEIYLRTFHNARRLPIRGQMYTNSSFLQKLSRRGILLQNCRFLR